MTGTTRKNRPTDRKKQTGAPSEPPEQQLGDTPVAPWQMPTPEEKEQARPVRQALKEAIRKVDTPEKAEAVVENLESATAGKSAAEVEKQQERAGPAEPAKDIARAAKMAPPGAKPERVLEETARALASADQKQREVVSEAAQEILNPEQQGVPPTVESPRQREYLREAVLRRLKPLDALDANLFLKVNHLPHTRLLNTLFYGITMAYKGGAAWYITMMLAALGRPGTARTLFREAAVPMAISSSLVEFPIKNYFKRRRPFITIIQAIVIGRKPGNYSFPSGHSAAAFAGAWLINQKYPRWSPLTYTAASLVAFSRMYLGDHYPGDVASGSALGVLFAMAFKWLFRRRAR